MLKKIKEFFYDLWCEKIEPVVDFLPRKFRRIKHVLAWVPLLWKDFDWDYGYLLLVLHFKLSRMRDTILANNIIVEAERVAGEIDICVKALERIMENDYTKGEEEEFTEKYGEHKYSVGKNNIVDFYFEKARLKGLDDEADKEWWKLRELGEERLKRDYHLLFTTMEEKIRGWWD